MNLFEEAGARGGARDETWPDAPLAHRMRPRTLDEFVGQRHFLGEGKLLRRMLLADRITSVIFYGPPGTGKTTLAHVIAHTTRADFEQINAADSSVKELREKIGLARERRERGGRTVIFVDELHRFNRAQQDALLPDVESGTFIFVAATTFNPFFAINSPLISRSQIFEFKPLTQDDIRAVLLRAAADKERGLGAWRITIDDAAVAFLAEKSDGDARRALTALEVGVLSCGAPPGGEVVYNLAMAEESIQRKALVYDRDEDEHYDTISAFIKSIRGSDPDAALYWLAKMLEGGEEPRFIARRLVILASEDVGNASPNGLVLATSAMQACEMVGMPEARIILAQATTYLACCPKSNASYMGLEKAAEHVRSGRTLPVPDHLKSTGYKGAQRLGRGTGYKYAHDFDGHWVDQDYMPTSAVFYEPTDQGQERAIKERLDEWRRRRRGGESKTPSAE
ncbi:MAG TPA: replication-associated recombination protein A [Candidatus Brocadiia bacterium]|nr:replication-associated recombination protein A [Candidatus Brocadiia bacterium]